MTENQVDRQAGKLTRRQADAGHSGRQAGKLTEKQVDRQAGRRSHVGEAGERTSRQTGKRAGRPDDKTKKRNKIRKHSFHFSSFHVFHQGT